MHQHTPCNVPLASDALFFAEPGVSFLCQLTSFKRFNYNDCKSENIIAGGGFVFKILLLIIAGGLLIGAYIIRKGIGCLFTIIAIIIIGLIVVPFIRGTVSDSPGDSGSNTDSAVEQESGDYTQVYFDELADELSKGVDEAKSKYLDQKVVLAGDFDSIDSDGNIVMSYDDTDLLVVGRMQTDEQRGKSGEFSKGDTVIVKGIITDIDESAYFMDIEDIG